MPQKVTQETLNDFIATVRAKGADYKPVDYLKRFPEFENNSKLLDAAFDYYHTFEATGGKEDISSKFPEFEEYSEE